MKKIFVLPAFAVLVILSCTKKDEVLPVYTPTQIFAVNLKMSHNIDSVNIGDTIAITATGLVADTTNTFSANLKTFSGSVGTTGAFTSSGVQVAGILVRQPFTKVISAPSGTSPLYNWAATYRVPVPSVPHNTNILITGYFENSLTLSSQTGNQVASDSKAVFVK